jgi:hypothetical protein
MNRGALLSAFVVGTSAVVSVPCLAAEDDAGAEIAGQVGFGTTFDESNVLGPGVGLRAGYATESDVYVGLSGLVHFGSHDEGEPDVRHYSESLRLELGFAVDIFPLEFRPSLRGGVARITTPRDVDDRFFSPDIGLGAMLVVRLKNGPFVGFDAEARYFTRLVNNGDNAFVITTAAVYAVGGYRY